jgi:hypothetical protein
MAVVTTAAIWNRIKRAQTYPDTSGDVPDWFNRFLVAQYFQLTNQANAMLTDIQAMKVSGMLINVASAAVVLPVPYPDANYTITALADWATTLFWSAQTKTGFTLNFGVNTPAGTNNVYVHTIR